MKRFLIIIGLIFSVVVLNGQTNIDKYVRGDQYVSYVDGVSGDTASGATGYFDYEFNLGEKSKLQLYTVSVGLDSTSGTSSVSTYLAKSYDAGVTWYDIDTIDFAMSTSDTALIFQDVSTGTDATRLRIKTFGAASTVATLDYIYLRVVDKQ